MKQVTTTTGETIRFLLRGKSPFMFDPVKVIVVSDDDAALLTERLGSQLSIADISDNEAKTMIEEQANEELNGSGEVDGAAAGQTTDTAAADQAAADAKAAEEKAAADKAAADAAQAEADAKAKADADAAAAGQTGGAQ